MLDCTRDLKTAPPVPTSWRPRLLMAIALATIPGLASGQSDDVEIKTVAVGDGVWMLEGRGGNIGVSAGEDGVVLIDDQFAPLTDKIRAAVKEIADEPIRFVLNTHWHGDHTGGNEKLGQAGAVIVAHDNVRKQMSVEHSWRDRIIPAAPDGALPVVTFTQSVTFHLNGEQIHAIHVPHAHTDGDSLVHFPQANVLHMGDVLFNGIYPFIDTATGGSIDGVLSAVDQALEIVDGETRIIAGHGPLADREALTTYREMLSTVRGSIASLMASGNSLEQVQAARPTSEFDETWGGGFIDPDRFVEIVYTSLSR